MPLDENIRPIEYLRHMKALHDSILQKDALTPEIKADFTQQWLFESVYVAGRAHGLRVNEKDGVPSLSLEPEVLARKQFYSPSKRWNCGVWDRAFGGRYGLTRATIPSRRGQIVQEFPDQ